MQPLGLFSPQPVIGNQTLINNKPVSYTSSDTNPLNTNSPDTVFFLGAMTGLLGGNPPAGNQLLTDPVSGFTYNPTAANPFLTPGAPQNINLAELFGSLPTQFWSTILSLLMNPQAASANQPPVSLTADPTSTAATVAAPSTEESPTATAAEPAKKTNPPAAAPPKKKTGSGSTGNQSGSKNTAQPPTVISTVPEEKDIGRGMIRVTPVTTLSDGSTKRGKSVVMA